MLSVPEINYGANVTVLYKAHPTFTQSPCGACLGFLSSAWFHGVIDFSFVTTGQFAENETNAVKFREIP